MSVKSKGFVYRSKIELRSKECIDHVIQPLIDHIQIPINGSLTCKDIFQTLVSIAVDKLQFILSRKGIKKSLVKYRSDII